MPFTSKISEVKANGGSRTRVSLISVTSDYPLKFFCQESLKLNSKWRFERADGTTYKGKTVNGTFLAFNKGQG